MTDKTMKTAVEVAKAMFEPKWQVYIYDENGNETPFGKPFDNYEDAEKFMGLADAPTMRKVYHD